MSDDLISRSALLVRLAKVFVPADGFGQGISMGIDHAIGVIGAAPAVDAVIPVRCGECKNWDTEKRYCHHPAGLSFCGKKAAVEGFCCFGERRDNHA